VKDQMRGFGLTILFFVLGLVLDSSTIQPLPLYSIGSTPPQIGQSFKVPSSAKELIIGLNSSVAVEHGIALASQEEFIDQLLIKIQTGTFEEQRVAAYELGMIISPWLRGKLSEFYFVYGLDPNGTDFRRFIVYDLMPRSTDLSGFHGFEFNEGGA